MNVSGGEPCEVQDNVRKESTSTVTVDNDGLSISGVAAYTRNMKGGYIMGCSIWIK